MRPGRSRRACLVALPLAAALLLGGCHWGTYSDSGTTSFGHAYFVAVHQGNTDGTIHACDDDPGSLAEASCVLDVIRYACHADPLKGWSPSECDQATDHAGATCRTGSGSFESCAVSMRKTIDQIRHERGQCLTYEQNYVGPSRLWDALYTSPGC
jgi:hypothetical protein